MDKATFIYQYVLNRARGNSGSLEGEIAVKEAIKAWNAIQRELAR